jgi:cytochrome c5
MMSNPSASPTHAALSRAASFVFAPALAVGLVWMGADVAPALDQMAGWPEVSVEKPTSEARSPAGNGADIANSQCLRCHSKEINVEP